MAGYPPAAGPRGEQVDGADDELLADLLIGVSHDEGATRCGQAAAEGEQFIPGNRNAE
jgi:hypothetical protein